MTPAVEMIGLGKRYGRSVALAATDLVIRRGEIFGFVGQNGAGKTTTLRMLATAIVPSSGEARVCGIDVFLDPDGVRRVVGYMPDTFGVYDDIRVWEYLDFFAHCHGLRAAARRRAVDDLLDLVDLADRRTALVQSLSRGMQQRLCLAHALVHDPQVLLLDEPASGMDPGARAELQELLLELRAMGKTIVISSHILPELEAVCSGVAIFDGGRVIASGSIEAIRARVRHGALARMRIVGGADATGLAAAYLAVQPEVVEVQPVDDGRLELTLRSDEVGTASLLARATAAGHRVADLVPASNDLEDLFFRITGDAGAVAS